MSRYGGKTHGPGCTGGEYFCQRLYLVWLIRAGPCPLPRLFDSHRLPHFGMQRTRAPDRGYPDKQQTKRISVI
jgi:hypothetical protein